MMESVLSNEEVQTAISEYLSVHKGEIRQKIDKKIDTAVNAAINEAFSSTYRNEGWGRIAVFDAVKGAAEPIIENDITIDAQAIREKAQKQVNAQINKIKVNLGVRV
jgi:hypothetical protein